MRRCSGTVLWIGTGAAFIATRSWSWFTSPGSELHDAVQFFCDLWSASSALTIDAESNAVRVARDNSAFVERDNKGYDEQNDSDSDEQDDDESEPEQGPDIR